MEYSLIPRMLTSNLRRIPRKYHVGKIRRKYHVGEIRRKYHVK